MNNSIFVGGFGGSGTRALQMLFEKAGFYVGEAEKNINAFYDFTGLNEKVTDNFLGWYKKEITDEIYKKSFDFYSISNKTNWSLKWGHFMYMIPTLKMWHPESKFILVVRHPIDNVFNENRNPGSQYFPWNFFEGKPDDISLEERLDYYEKVTKEALKHTDFIFRLEDFCEKPAENIQKLFNFIGLNDDVSGYIDLISTPTSIGLRGDVTSNNEIIKILGY